MLYDKIPDRASRPVIVLYLLMLMLMLTMGELRRRALRPYIFL